MALLLWLMIGLQTARAMEHEFHLKKADAQNVGLVGEFNGWKAQPMTKRTDGTWTVTVSLPKGTHGYKFLVNGSDWIFDPENPSRKKVDGVDNSAIEINEENRAIAATSSPRMTTTASPSPNPPNPERSALNFNVLAERKRFEFDRSGNQHTVTTKEKWGYKVTLENKTFKTVNGLDLQYRQFKLDDSLRGASGLVSTSGSIAISPMETGQKFSFETAPAEVERQELRPGWTYSDGAKAKVKDALVGLWIRIFDGGEIAFEWQSSPDLKTKAKWD